MTIITPPAIDLSAPALDAETREYWEPTSIHDTVFPEPNRRELAVAESAVRQFQDRVVEEIRWLHEIIQEQATAITELETGGAVELKASAIAEAAHIGRQARANADRHMAEAHHKIERMQADALRRIAAAERAVTPDVEPTALPPLDARDLAGSMRRRVDYVRKLNAEIRADARLMTEAAGLADDLDRPYEPEPEQTPEPSSAPPASPVPAPALTEITSELITVRNESGEDQLIRWGDRPVLVQPDETVTGYAQFLTDEDRAKLAGLDPDLAPLPQLIEQIIADERDSHVQWGRSASAGHHQHLIDPAPPVPAEEHHDDHEAAEAEQAHDAESVDDAPH